ncbi:SCO family protein [Enterovirga rhinocerotis]|uniref:Protein SCO1/2 n=1 Tax=Enterovirga rhinocerotis TaxID=1339210 RepID=A0A4R7BNA3_9HYPH|nr:SCO family protein [Enterovirga rhinocerotis]TDR85407.1 protein SCO1/2 [Enterovirga rhinocerotis]
MTDRTRRLAAPIAAFLFGLVALGVAAYMTLAPEPRRQAAANIGGPFTLVNGDGKTVTEKEFRGAPHLVFFGFTHCPDVCPTKLQELSEVLEKLPRQGEKVRALFITVDPQRDTPEVMKSYVSSFDNRIVGLTGDQAEIDKVVKSYRAFAKKVPIKDDDYTMEHTGLVYLMDKRGDFIGSLRLDRPAEESAKEIVRYL